MNSASLGVGSTIVASEGFLQGCWGSREAAPQHLGVRTNFALTFWFELMSRTHGAVPEQPPPDQPMNTDPSDGVAISSTEASWS